MPIDWSSMPSSYLRAEAALYRRDHDDGSDCFFDAREANWSFQELDPTTLGTFSSVEEAGGWLQQEIASFRADGDRRAENYEGMLRDGFNDPVIVGCCEGRSALWDGYHRTAIAMVRREPLPAIVGVRHTKV